MRITMLSTDATFVDPDRAQSCVPGTPKLAIWQRIQPGLCVKIE